MKINQHVKFWSSYNAKMFKISTGFSWKLEIYNSLNLALCRACLYEHFCASQLYLKKPRENQNIDLFDHLYEAILCDSCYVFPALARPFYVPSFALLESLAHFVNFCFKTPVGIKLSHRKATFCALVPVGSHLHFLCHRDLEGVQDTFFEKCENVSKIKGNSSKRWVYELLKHQNIQNQPRIISKIESM